jgi:hypothetical protein
MSRGDGPVIRLGSLAGYAFEGPRVLAGWTPPAEPGVFVVLYRPAGEKQPERYAVMYVGHAEDLSAVGLPFQHPRTPCWVERAGSKFGLFIATFSVPGGTAGHREQIVRELSATYRPSCNPEQFENAWEDDWIGSYQAPTAGPLTTRRSLDGEPPDPPPDD